jgi:7-cyano-7-deazaguanine reductase
MPEAHGKVFPFDGPERIDSSLLDTFPYEYPDREIELVVETDEFTCVCPFSGLPDFARIRVVYVPDKLCLELRSYKYYLLTYRNVGIYHEHVINHILEDLVARVKPKRMKVIGDYEIRGGIHTVGSVEYVKND